MAANRFLQDAARSGLSKFCQHLLLPACAPERGQRWYRYYAHYAINCCRFYAGPGELGRTARHAADCSSAFSRTAFALRLPAFLCCYRLRGCGACGCTPLRVIPGLFALSFPGRAFGRAVYSRRDGRCGVWWTDVYQTTFFSWDGIPSYTPGGTDCYRVCFVEGALLLLCRCLHSSSGSIVRALGWNFAHPPALSIQPVLRCWQRAATTALPRVIRAQFLFGHATGTILCCPIAALFFVIACLLCQTQLYHTPW